MKKLVLINPHPIGNVGEENVSVLNQMPVNLGYLKALTPKHWQVDIIDETQEPAIDDAGDITFGGADLVGITSVSYQANRAYQIATACKKRGIPVIIGGIHATSHPEEAAKYVDCVVIREAVTLWENIITDFDKGCLQKRYDGGLTPMEIYHGLRSDRAFLKDKYKYRYSGIITTAGCPFSCEFCSVPQFQGKKYRERPIEDVLDELESIKGQYRGLILTDENFYGHSKKSNERVRDLFKGMVERGIYQNWFGFTSLNIYKDDETLDYMVKSGCVGVLIGIESINEEALKTMNKNVNLRISIEKYFEAIENIRKHGLAVWGTMVFGNDADTPETFKQVADFVLDSHVDIMTCGILCPFINTPLYMRLKGDGRLFRTNFPEDWKYYTSHHLTYILKNMSLQELIDGFQYLFDKIYSTEVLRKRFQNAKEILGIKNMNAAMFAFRVNLDWQNVYQHLIQNLKELQSSGFYDEALKKYNQYKKADKNIELTPVGA
ncbi:MAG TPA: B12-binding domain-containing radical SAM protein [Candidatus Wujingus californicus]|uniref:B12-binding domain-containing radical SAM protein n=1 Tax=Candidatus Wujingus californicus TaxID=3367618 RepID=UPI001DC839CE|nr:radical SAM protein [Planctomycetota bacterium]MDO8131526.1 radical SAM protein [Candidatus Brocadiales bacterium]